MSTLSTTNLKNPSSGSNNIVLATDGSATIATLSSTTITGTTIQGTIKSGTAVASTSGTSIDFTSIPSWVKRVTVMFNGVSTNGTSPVRVQLGAGSIESTGYSGSSGVFATAVGFALVSAGFDFVGTETSQSATYTRGGILALCLLGSNTWVANGNLGLSDTARAYSITGLKSLSGTLDRVRITTVNGTDTFDAGSINILYEG
jgi:hypothetical protein